MVMRDTTDSVNVTGVTVAAAASAAVTARIGVRSGESDGMTWFRTPFSVSVSIPETWGAVPRGLSRRLVRPWHHNGEVHEATPGPDGGDAPDPGPLAHELAEAAGADMDSEPTPYSFTHDGHAALALSFCKRKDQEPRLLGYELPVDITLTAEGRMTLRYRSPFNGGGMTEASTVIPEPLRSRVWDRLTAARHLGH